MLSLNAIFILSAIAGGLGAALAILDRYLASYGICHVDINNGAEESFDIEGGVTILQAINANNIFIPAACGGRATCGLCKLQVLEGGGLVLPTETPFFNKQEMKQGYRLACQVKIKNDIKILIPEEYLKVQRFRTEVVAIEDMTHDTKLIRMKLIEPDTIEFKPGQFIQFEIPGTNEFRAYSIASKPSMKHFVEIIVRLVPGGLCTTYIFEELTVGQEIYITGPFGEFYWHEESDREMVCVAGGSGVAPIRSILDTMFEKNITDRKVTYFYGARAVKDLYYYHECLEYEKKFPNFKYVPALSAMDPGDKWDGETGFIHLVIDKYYDDCSDKEAYLCGPPVMIDAVIEVLRKKGMPEEYIYFDKF